MEYKQQPKIMSSSSQKVIMKYQLDADGNRIGQGVPVPPFSSFVVSPSVQVISYENYNQSLKSKVGSLMFPDEIYNTTHLVDLKKLKKNIGSQFPSHAKKIVGVLVHTTSSPLFKNIQNMKVPYKTPVCAMEEQDGAYLLNKYGFESFVSDYPVGDVIVVYE